MKQVAEHGCFDQKALVQLIEMRGCDLADVAKETQLSEATLAAYLHGMAQPDLAHVVALADYFGTTCDAVIGRTQAYEYVALSNAEVRNLAWPYNLLACINGGPNSRAKLVDFLVSDEHAEYISELVGAVLPQREADAVLKHMRDGMAIRDLAKRRVMKPSQISHLIYRGVAHLQAEPLRTKLLGGPEVGTKADIMATCEKELEKRFAEVEMRQMELIEEERKAVMREHEIRLRAGKLRVLVNGEQSPENITVDEWLNRELTPLPDWSGVESGVVEMNSPIYNTPVGNLDLTLRAYHCLARAGLHRLRDVVECTRMGQLAELRNVGKQTLNEILATVLKYTGRDYSELYVRQ